MRGAAAGSLGCAALVAVTALLWSVLLSDPPNTTAGLSVRGELLFASTLPGSFDGCGSCPFFALAASQELAQKYQLTTAMAMQAPCGKRKAIRQKKSFGRSRFGGAEITLSLSR